MTGPLDQDAKRSMSRIVTADSKSGQKPVGSRFTILDAMILVAATAAGIALLRATGFGVKELQIWMSRPGITAGMRKFELIQYGLSVPLPCLTTWTFAFLILRATATTTPHAAAFPSAGDHRMQCGRSSSIHRSRMVPSPSLATRSRFIQLETVFVGYAQQVSFSVAGAWLTLALSGRWKSETSWIDRLGRALGFAWIVTTIISWGRYFLI